MAKRIDAVDGLAYTYDEMQFFYAGTYKKKEIKAYWETCKPAKDERKDAVPSMAKVEAKTEPTTLGNSLSKLIESFTNNMSHEDMPGEKTHVATLSRRRTAFVVGNDGQTITGLGPRAIKVKEGVSVIHLFGPESKQRTGFEVWFIAPGCSMAWGDYRPPSGFYHDYEMILRCLAGDFGLSVGGSELRRFAFRDLCLVPDLKKTIKDGGIFFQNHYSDQPAVVFCAVGPCLPTGFALCRTPAGFIPGPSHAQKNWLQAFLVVLKHMNGGNKVRPFSYLQMKIALRWTKLGDDSHSLARVVPPRTEAASIFSNTAKEPFIFTKQLHNGEGEMTRHSFFNDKSRQASTIQLWNMRPGSSEGMHIHSGVGNDMPSVGNLEEIYVCLAGKGKITLKDGDDLEMTAGDAAIAPACVWHGVEVSGDKNFFLMVCWGSEEAPKMQYRSHIRGRRY